MVRGSDPSAISVPDFIPLVITKRDALLVVARGCVVALEPSSGVKTGSAVDAADGVCAGGGVGVLDAPADAAVGSRRRRTR